MALTLIIEDGSGMSGSQSYADATTLRAYAKVRGATLPTDDASCEALLLAAMDRLEGEAYKGDRVSPAQALLWPRTGVWVENWPIAANEIPLKLIQAQCAYAIESQTVDLLPTTDIQDPGQIVSETVGPVQTVYSNTGIVRRLPAVAKADALLRTLLHRAGIRAVRL